MAFLAIQYMLLWNKDVAKTANFQTVDCNFREFNFSARPLPVWKWRSWYCKVLARKVQYWQLIDIPRPISSYCFNKDICPSPNLYPNLLQLPILHLYVLWGMGTFVRKSTRPRRIMSSCIMLCQQFLENYVTLCFRGSFTMLNYVMAFTFDPRAGPSHLL